jgi:hypothetical protein
MNKRTFIKWLEKYPNDIQIFITEPDEYDCVDAKIFIKPKDNDFFEWYFLP